MFIIVDSGATGCKWKFVSDEGRGVDEVVLGGINFAHQAGDLEAALGEEGFKSLEDTILRHPDVGRVFFYGAGIIAREGERIPAVMKDVDAFFERYYPGSEREYASDLLAAARAVCGHGKGIAAILGTGSNSCLYDGKAIVSNVHSSGYILGDEGSGVALGRDFMADFLKGLVPEGLAAGFASEFKADYLTVVENVYKGPRPAAYLSSFAPWIMHHYESSPYVRELAEENFRRFVRRCLRQYDTDRYEVGVVGGFGKANEAVLRKVFAEEGVAVSSITASPLEGLMEYHSHGV